MVAAKVKAATLMGPDDLVLDNLYTLPNQIEANSTRDGAS